MAAVNLLVSLVVNVIDLLKFGTWYLPSMIKIKMVITIH